MEENQQNKQGNAKGLIIIIALVVVAIAVYFIVQGVNKKNKNGTDQPTVSISEADRLELSSLNLLGKWNKTVGTDRYELNFKSDHVLVLTQYDANGEVIVKSDEGTFSVDDGILNLTVVAGTPYTASCNAVVSVEYLVITTIEGSNLFAGTYTADLGDVPDFDTSDDTSSAPSTSPDNSNQSEPTQSSNNTSTSEPSTSTPVGEYHLPAIVDTLFSKTKEEYPPSVNEEYNFYITEGQYTFYPYYNSTTPTTSQLMTLTVDIKQLFPELNGYSYYDLQSVFGDDLTYSISYDDMGDINYKITAIVDEYELLFCNHVNYVKHLPVYSLDTEVSCCVISRSGNQAPDTEYHMPDNLPTVFNNLFSKTAEEYFNGNVPPSTDKFMAVYQVYNGEYTIDVYYGVSANSNIGSIYGTGYPNMLCVKVDEMFPGLDSYNYNSLKEILGDKLTYWADGDQGVNFYNVVAYDVDGFDLSFGYIDGGLMSLDEEIEYCIIRAIERI